MTEINDARSNEIVADADHAFQVAQAYVIDGPEMYEMGLKESQHINAKIKQIEEHRVFLKAPVLEQGRRIDAFFKVPIDRLTEARKIILGATGTWKRLQDERAAEERRKAEAAARIERERLQKEADDKAAALIAEGKTEEAEAVQVPIVVPTMPTVQAVQKVAGISYRTDWKFRVVDAALVPEEFKIVNEKALASLAKSTKGTKKVPGVEFYSEEVTVDRGF
jgi:hypothetical protein